MTDPLAVDEGCDSEHKRVCPPPCLTRSIPAHPDRPFATWTWRDLPHLYRLLVSRPRN